MFLSRINKVIKVFSFSFSYLCFFLFSFSFFFTKKKEKEKRKKEFFENSLFKDKKIGRIRDGKKAACVGEPARG